MTNPDELLDVVPAPAGAVVTADGPIVHLCPYRDEVDEGTARIRWRTLSHTIELHSLRKYLDAFEDAPLSHEAVVDLITGHLAQLGGIELLGVEARFVTAGFDVTAGFSQ